MTYTPPVASFAMCTVPGSTSAVRRLAVSADAQQAIEAMIRDQFESLVADTLTRVPFDPTFATDSDTVLCIHGFDLPTDIRDAIGTVREVPLFGRGEEVRSVRFLFHADAGGNVFFQCWRNFDLLGRRKLWLLSSGETFDIEAAKTPLTIEHRLDAVLWGGDLLFRSYANASSMLEMLEYVIEATVGDIQELVGCQLLAGDAAAIEASCSRLHKRQIRALVQGGLLDRLANETIASLTQKSDEVRYALPLQGEQIAIPSGGPELTEFLRFLDDKIYRGPVTGDFFVANSARRRD